MSASRLAIATAVTAVALLVAEIVRRKLALGGRRRAIKAGTTVVITGGGSGIGLEIALNFSGKKCHVVLVGRTEAILIEATEACRKAGAASATAVPCDITKPEDVVRLAAHESTQAASILVLNAGRGGITPFDTTESSYAICERLMELNYFANVRLMQLFLERLEASKGAFLVIGSLAAVLPSAHRAAYTASKHAMQGFCNAFRQELNRATLTVACPGYVDTPFHDNVMKTASSSGGHSNRKCMSPGECAGRCVTALERGRFEEIMTLQGKLGYMLRPFIPAIIDSIAKKKALKSIGK